MMFTYPFMKMKLRMMILKSNLKRFRLRKGKLRLTRLIVGGILLSLRWIRMGKKGQSVMVATRYLCVVEETMELLI